MEGIQKGIAQHWGKAFVALIVLAIIVAYTSISSMDEEASDLVLEFFQDYLPLCMFVMPFCFFPDFPSHSYSGASLSCTACSVISSICFH